MNEQSCTLSDVELAAHKSTLFELLCQMLEEVGAPNSLIEYGDPDRPGGYLTYLRIRRMRPVFDQTPDTFRLTETNSLGVEGGGVYEPDVHRMVDLATSLLKRYHRVTPFHLKASRTVSTSLKWFRYPLAQKPKPRVAPTVPYFSSHEKTINF